jgi:hypothetical protein
MHPWTRDACTSAKGAGLLERKQARACRAAPDVMPSLVQAAKDTSTVCQQAFRHRRWNCSSIERAPHYTPELLTGAREKESHAEAPRDLAQGGSLADISLTALARGPLITIVCLIKSRARGPPFRPAPALSRIDPRPAFIIREFCASRGGCECPMTVPAGCVSDIL